MYKSVLRTGAKPAVLLFVLIFLALGTAACGGAKAPEAETPSAATSAPEPATQTPLTEPATEAPPVTGTQVAVAAQTVDDDGVPVGVDENGNFYRGDPSAPVILTEYSDYQ